MDPVRLSRTRLYFLIEAFEQDMREIFSKHILSQRSEFEAFGPAYEGAVARRDAEEPEEATELVHYLDLRPCYDRLNTNRDDIPAGLAREIRSNTVQIDRLVPIRNRVMHGRPLRSGDAEVVVSALGSFKNPSWANLSRAFNRLESEPLWEPSVEFLPPTIERVLHNLPLADYDETGLIGRENEIALLRKMVTRRRDSIITVTGEGGVGKTALALEVAYQIIDDPETPFDCVLWASLKSERLTPAGIESIIEAIEGVSGVTRELGRAFGSTLDGTFDQLSEILTDLDSLIIIDNLESVDGSEVLRLYDAMPEGVTFLFTSRVGIGEVERRFPIGPLDENSAVSLLRRFARARNVDQLSRLSERSASEVVVRLRRTPIAIRWYVLSIESGADPLATLRDQRELLKFCVANVVESLSDDAISVLEVVRALDRAATIDEIAVLSEMEFDALRLATRELSRGSLVQLDSENRGSLPSRIGPSIAVREYLPRQSIPQDRLATLLSREIELRKSEERRQSQIRGRSLAPFVVYTRDDEDVPCAHVLWKALTASKRKNYTLAFETVERARKMNPNFYEVDRVEAFIASMNGETGRAQALYMSALEKAESDEAIAIVSHFYAGHLGRKMHDTTRAIEFQLVAHDHFKSGDTATPLGSFLVWANLFIEGLELLEFAVEHSEGKSRLIATTSLVEGWRRRSEHALDEHESSNAFEYAWIAFELGNRALGGRTDQRLAASVCDSVGQLARSATRANEVDSDMWEQFEVALNALLSDIQLFRGCRGWSRTSRELELLLSAGKVPQHISQIVHAILDPGVSFPADDGNVELMLVGSVCGWKDTYGFIAHSDFPDNLFFHRGALHGAPDGVSEGDLVEFRVAAEADRPRASFVRLRHA